MGWDRLSCGWEYFEIIKKHVKKDTKICCVIKVNAYGHGAVELGKLYEKSGADYFAVSNINEAIQLRKKGYHCQY